jgi:ribosomal protein S18 acetylase RimI-like enzyme
MSGLLDESGHDFLASVDSLEDCLDTRSMYRRLTRSSKQRLLDEIEILDYRPTFKKHFKELNYRWLGQRFEVERHDEEILSDPLGKIIKPGGSVLFARLKGRIVGTIALIRHDGGTWEAAKLAVAEEARERYVGTRLMEAVIARARESGADKLHLETNPKDARLIGFLEGFGFRKSHSTPLPARYKRPRLTMELALTD